MEGNDEERTIEGLTQLLSSNSLTPEEKGDILYKRALLHEKNRDFENSLSDYEACVESCPSNPKYLVRLSFLRVSQFGRVQKALEGYSKSIELKGDFPEAFLSRGLLYENHLQDFDRALADYSKCIEINPEYVFGFNNRGLLFEKRFNDFDSALKDYSRAIELAPRHWEAHFNRGLLLENRKIAKYEESLEDYSACIKIDSKKSWKPYFRRGRLYQKFFVKLDKSVLDYDFVLANFKEELNAKEESDVLFGRGTVHHRLKEFNKALHDYMGAIQLSPTVKMYINRGKLYLDHFKLVELALSDFNRAIEMAPRGSHAHQAYFKRSGLYKKLKKRKLALKDINKCIKLRPDFYKGYVNRANLYVQMGSNTKALRDYHKAVELLDKENLELNTLGGPLMFSQEKNPKGKKKRSSDCIHNNIGFLHMFHNKDLQAALESFDKAIAINPENAQAFLNRGIVHRKMGNESACVDDFSKAILLREFSFDKAYNERGEVYAEMGKHELANADFIKAVEINAYNVKATFNRAKLNMQVFKKVDLALMGFNRVVKLDPTHSNAYIMRAKLKKEHLGKNDEALDDYSKAMELKEKEESPTKTSPMRGSYFEEIFLQEAEDEDNVDVGKKMEKIAMEKGNLLKLIGEVLPKSRNHFTVDKLVLPKKVGEKEERLLRMNHFIVQVCRFIYQFFHYFSFLIKLEWERKVYDSFEEISKMLQAETPQTKNSAQEKIKKFIHEFCLKEVVLHSPEEYHVKLVGEMERIKFSTTFIFFSILKTHKVMEFRRFFHAQMLQYFNERIIMYVKTQYFINFVLLVQKRICREEAAELLKKAINLSIQNCDEKIIKCLDSFSKCVKSCLVGINYTDSMMDEIHQNWEKSTESDQNCQLTKERFKVILWERKLNKKFEEIENVAKEVETKFSTICKQEDMVGFEALFAKMKKNLKRLDRLFLKEESVHVNLKRRKATLYSFVKDKKKAILNRTKALKTKEYLFEGTWTEDGQFKEGKLFFRDKLIYEGEFYEGKYHGKGTLYHADEGTFTKGLWKFGNVHFLELSMDYVRTKCIVLPKLSSDDLIGSGSYSTVFKFEKDGEILAAKVIKKEYLEMGYIRDEDIMQEARQMMALNHPNVVKCPYISLNSPKAIVTEYCDLNSLNHYVRKKKSRKKRVTFRRILKILEQIANGMKYLHSCDCVHRDLKNENILLKTGENGEIVCKIIDFGTSKRLEEAKTRHMNSNVGSMFYVAPEIMKKPERGYTRTCDVFSYGVIVFILFYQMEYQELMKYFHPQDILESSWVVEAPSTCAYFTVKKKSGEDQQIRNLQTARLVGVMKRCVVRDPEKRPTFDVVHEEMVEIIEIGLEAERRRREEARKKKKRRKSSKRGDVVDVIKKDEEVNNDNE